MPRKKDHAFEETNVIGLRLPRNLARTRTVEFELPEFLIYALERRIHEANEEALPHQYSSLNDLVMSELVNVITLRDIAELEFSLPGFAAAVNDWLAELPP
jgi:hypothetical protein